MSNVTSAIATSEITHYRAVNSHGEQIGIVEDLVATKKNEVIHVVLSTNQKELYGNLQYTVPFDIAEIDPSHKVIWLNINKSESEFTSNIIDLYEKISLPWNSCIENFNDAVDPTASNSIDQCSNF